MVSPIQYLPVSPVHHLSYLSHLSTQPSLCVFVEGDSVNILKWANVSLIPNCRSYYKERFYDGMMCAGMCVYTLPHLSHLSCLT